MRVQEGRRFAITLALGFLIFSLLFAWKGHGLFACAPALVGFAFLLAGFFFPSRLGPIHRGWMKAARQVSRISTPIVLSVVFYGIITPVGVLLRITGRHPIAHRKVNGSYWRERAEEKRRSDLERQS